MLFEYTNKYGVIYENFPEKIPPIFLLFTGKGRERNRGCYFSLLRGFSFQGGPEIYQI